jgi:DNA-binding CsgD family transcriptional regulator
VVGLREPLDIAASRNLKSAAGLGPKWGLATKTANAPGAIVERVRRVGATDIRKRRRGGRNVELGQLSLFKKDRGSRGTEPVASLTNSQRIVAELVAQGLTNREVAARIFLSPHTVDFYLRQIFRKLDVRSRVALTRLVVESNSGAGTDAEHRRGSAA